MTTTNHRTTAGVLMIAGAVLANVAFTLLGSSFDYPDVLREPAVDVLRTFDADAVQIGALFGLLALASAVLIPAALAARHLMDPARPRLRRLMVVAGVAAGVVQVAGLLRWPVLVPHLADVVADPATSAAARADAVDTFRFFHSWLGGLVGEAFGYALTATWTVAIVRGMARRPGRWFAPLGWASAVLIVTGLLEPLGVEAAGTTNFVGYLAWSAWMIAVGTSLVRRPVSVLIAGTRRPAATLAGR